TAITEEAPDSRNTALAATASASSTSAQTLGIAQKQSRHTSLQLAKSLYDGRYRPAARSNSHLGKSFVRNSYSRITIMRTGMILNNKGSAHVRPFRSLSTGRRSHRRQSACLRQ